MNQCFSGNAGIDGNSKSAGEIVAGAEGENPEGDITPHQAIDDVVVGPVSARRHHHVGSRLGGPASQLDQVLATPALFDFGVYACSAQYLESLIEPPAGFVPAGRRIQEDRQSHGVVTRSMAKVPLGSQAERDDRRTLVNPSDGHYGEVVCHRYPRPERG